MSTFISGISGDSAWTHQLVLQIHRATLLILKHSYMPFLLIDSPPSLW